MDEWMDHFFPKSDLNYFVKKQQFYHVTSQNTPQTFDIFRIMERM